MGKSFDSKRPRSANTFPKTFDMCRIKEFIFWIFTIFHLVGKSVYRILGRFFRAIKRYTGYFLVLRQDSISPSVLVFERE